VELDIRDAAAVAAAAEQARPEVIFHLAAQIDVRKSVADPAFDAATNVEGTINVLRAAEAVGARVVNSSTGGAIYGEGQIIPAPEDHPVAPKAPYGLSKFCAEHYCALFARLHDVSTISLRYGNVFGPRQDPLGEAGVIAIFCGRLREGTRPTVFGDGLQTRDYVYVGDVVDANLRAASSDVSGSLNIGTGVPTSVIDIIEALAVHAPGDFAPEHLEARPGEVQDIALDASRARAELGWEPRIGLERGLELTLASVR
jgi:UDP-glucose 4-epimerase